MIKSSIRAGRYKSTFRCATPSNSCCAREETVAAGVSSAEASPSIDLTFGEEYVTPIFTSKRVRGRHRQSQSQFEFRRARKWLTQVTSVTSPFLDFWPRFSARENGLAGVAAVAVRLRDPVGRLLLLAADRRRRPPRPGHVGLLVNA